MNRNLAVGRAPELSKHACGCFESVNVEYCHICSVSDIGCFISVSVLILPRSLYLVCAPKTESGGLAFSALFIVLPCKCMSR